MKLLPLGKLVRMDDSSRKKPQPYQRHEDQGTTQLYVDAKPWEAAPQSSEDERREATAEVIEENTKTVKNREE